MQNSSSSENSCPPLTYSRSRNDTDDEAMTMSAISTDLSRYMATDKIDNALSLGGDKSYQSDTDSDTTTIAESICPSRCDNLPTEDKSKIDSIDSPRKCKLVRSASFTVDTPSFAFDQKNPDLSTSNAVANKIESKGISLTKDFINEQIKRLEDMQISLKEYHRMQLDDLTTRQERELETLETQKRFMQSALKDALAIPTNQSQEPKMDQKSIIKPKIETSTSKIKSIKSTTQIKRPNSEYFRSHSVNSRSQTTTHVAISRSPPPPLVRKSIPKSETLFATATKSIPNDNSVKSIPFDHTAKFATATKPPLFATLIKPSENEPIAKSEQLATATKSVSKNRKKSDMSPVAKEKLAAMVKGHLTRQWLKTDRVKKMTATIRDLQLQLTSLEEEQSLASVDEHFKRVVAFQLHCSKSEFRRLLVSETTSDRLNAIAHHRHLQKEIKRRQKPPYHLDEQHPFGLLSSATVKSLTRKTVVSRNESRLDAATTPRLLSPNPRKDSYHRKNLIRISPRPKTVLSPRKRKRIHSSLSSYSPSFCVLRSPRRLSALSVISQKKKNFQNDDNPGTSRSTTMNIRMTMNTVVGSQDQQRWSGFCQLSDKDDKKDKNRRPWR